ncbi:MAG: methyltransferase domain-containing protein [Actinomycetota bacterium]
MSTSADTSEDFQIPIEIAEAYEARFVPALFAEWAPITIDAADLGPGDHLLDVACGTGIVARTAREQFGSEVTVTGVDLNEAMLTVASRVEPEIDWRRGDVTDLPFERDSFDAAVSQMAFMFFPDRGRALAEMARVVRPGGRLAVVVPSALDVQPAYEPFVDVAVAHTGDEARSMLGTYWNCGDLPAFSALATSNGWSAVTSRTRIGTARFASVQDFVDTEIDGTPLAERISAAQRAAIVADLTPRLAAYETSGGLPIPFACNVVSARVG